MLAKKCCKTLNIKLAFSSFKGRSALAWYINSLVWDVIPFILAKRLLFTDKNSHIFKHLKSSSSCRDACVEGCLKIKEALHIMWERPNLNKQLQHYNVSLSF